MTVLSAPKSVLKLLSRRRQSSTGSNSDSSTTLVDCKLSSSEDDTHPKPKAFVTFAEHLNQYHDDKGAYRKIPAEQLWYSPQENREMKEANTFLLKNIVRTNVGSDDDNEPSTQAQPEQAPVQQALHQETYMGALEQTYLACLGANQENDELDPAVLARLCQQLQLWPGRAGLEGKATPAAQQDKQRLHRIVSLRMKQQQQKNKGEELLRETCSTLSRPRRLFAQYVAQAHHQQQVAAMSA